MSDSEIEGSSSGRPEPRADSVDVRGPDERSAQIQLAARWAESYAPTTSNADRAALMKRFRAVHAYVDAVIHDIEPPEVQL